MKDNTLVFIKNDTPLTTSRTVAEQFGKNHQHVMRDIRTLIQQMGGVSNFGQTPMFTETTWTNEQNGQTYPQYLMTRDGFALLAMGFTGKKALQSLRTFLQNVQSRQNLLFARLSQAGTQNPRQTAPSSEGG